MLEVRVNGVYKIEDLVEGLEVSKGTVYNFINEDGLKVARIRGTTYIRGSDLLTFLFGKEEPTQLRAIKGV